GRPARRAAARAPQRRRLDAPARAPRDALRAPPGRGRAALLDRDRAGHVRQGRLPLPRLSASPAAHASVRDGHDAVALSDATPLRILFATPEIAPWVKTGGLGDVSAALPAALAESGFDVRVLVPGYPALLAAFAQRRVLARLERPGGQLLPAA